MRIEMYSHHISTVCYFSLPGPTVDTQLGGWHIILAIIQLTQVTRNQNVFCSLSRGWGLEMGGVKAAAFILTPFKTRESI